MPFEKTDRGEHHRRALIRLIREHRAARGYAPSFRELGTALGLTPATVLYHLRRLWAEGAVRWEPNVARSLRVLEAEVEPRA